MAIDLGARGHRRDLHLSSDRPATSFTPPSLPRATHVVGRQVLAADANRLRIGALSRLTRPESGKSQNGGRDLRLRVLGVAVGLRCTPETLRA